MTQDANGAVLAPSTVRLCVGERDVPYTVGGNIVWQRKPCGGQVMEGSKFCMWHHRDDYLRPETVRGFIMPNAKITDRDEPSTEK
jgi:hypothetical protein